MNVQLKDITVTARDGRVSHLDQVYIRGSHVRFFIVPDMLRYVPLPFSILHVFELYTNIHSPQKCTNVQVPRRQRKRCRSGKRKSNSQQSASKWWTGRSSSGIKRGIAEKLNGNGNLHKGVGHILIWAFFLRTKKSQGRGAG